MAALPRIEYTSTFSLDGVSSPASPHRGRHMPALFKPIPLKSFTVVVSVVPADQLRRNSPVPTAASAHVTVEGTGGAAGVGGPPSMASSVPATGALSTPGFLMNASFTPASSSFALTKSFGDVFALKKAPGGGGGGGPLVSSGRPDSSFGSFQGFGASSSAAAAAAAAVNGLADPSVSETPVPNSQDSYRVHLLLPARTAQSTASASHSSANHVPAGRQSSLNSCANPSSDDGGNHEELSAATSSLESLRTAKPQQAAQVNEHWVLFQQLVHFVLSVAPRFEPPPTPPGFAFPVDLGLSFVQNTSIFSAAEALQHGRGGGGVAGSPPRQMIGDPSAGGSPAAPSALSTSKAEDPLVRGEEREARRAYMEAYLNAALQCDQVSCLKEVQSFVGYDAYVKSELARFRAMSRLSSRSSIAGSPLSSLMRSSSPSRLNGSPTEFSTRGPLGGSSQGTVSTASSACRRASTIAEAVLPSPTSTAAPLAARHTSGPDSLAASSSRTSEVASPQFTGAFSALPPVLLQSLLPPAAPPLSVLEETSNSPSTAAAAAAAAVALAGSTAQGSAAHTGGGREAIEVTDTPSSAASGGAQQRQIPIKSATTNNPGSSGDGSLSSVVAGQQEQRASRSLTGNESATTAPESAVTATAAAFGKSLAMSRSSSGTHHPLSSWEPPHSSQSPSASGSLILMGVAEVDGKKKGGVDDTEDERDEEDGGGSAESARTAASSIGLSASHPDGVHRHGGGHRHRDRRPRRGDGHHGEARHDARRNQHHVLEQRRRRGEAGETPQLMDTAAEGTATAAAAATATTTAPAILLRAHLKPLIQIAPETERMLTECFRMMDTEGCGYVSAADCLLFHVCATPDTFMETLYLYTGAANLSEEETSSAAAGRTPRGAQLEDLLPAWMRDCEGVVVGNPEYLMSCARFVDAVREILTVSAAMEGASDTTNTAGPAAATAETEKASSAHPHGTAQASVGGEGGSRNTTPASSAPSRSGLPAALAGSQQSRDGSRRAEDTPLPAFAENAGTAAHTGSVHSHSFAGSAPTEDVEVVTSAAAAPTVSLESWIDNYWLLMYSQLFTAVAALVVGAEATELRAALLDIRERAYLEMTAQVAAAVHHAAQQPSQRQGGEGAEAAAETEAPPPTANSPGRLVAGASPPSQLMSPPWVLREVASAVAAQPPILGCFDAFELLSFVYVISETGIGVVSVEDALQWLGTRPVQPATRFSLDEFASLLDVLSCSLPFADVLHCVRRRWSTPAVHSASTEGGGDDGKRGAADGVAASRQQHAHLLRLVSRCAAADPSGGREFNEVVQEQRWRRGRDADGRRCEQCHLARGVLEQQAALLESLSDENARLQQRIAELEAAASAAAQVSSMGPPSTTTTTTTTTTLTAARKETDEGPPSTVAPPPPASTAAPVGSQRTKDNASPARSHEDAQTDTYVPAHSHTNPSFSSPSPAMAGEHALLPLPHNHAARRTTLELVPVFTAEAGEGGNNRSPVGGGIDANTPRRSSRQARAAATQVARAGPLRYTVPPKYAQRQPQELELSFYLCRAAPRGEEKNGAATAAGAVRSSSSSGSTGAGGGPSAGPSVERLAVRDGAGRRVVALKLSGTVLYILAQDVEQRPARLPLHTDPLSPRLNSPRTPHGASTLAFAPARHSHLNVNGVLGRERNILHPNYADTDGDGGGSPPSFLRCCNVPDSALNAAPSGPDRHGCDPFDRSSIAGNERGVAQPGSRFSTAATRTSIEDQQPQRLVTRVELQAHVWYTMKLRMWWEQRTVDIVVTCAAAAAAALPHRTPSSEGALEGARCVYQGTVRMLDAAAVTGLSSIEVFPRREMLVAYCNALLRYEAEQR